MMQDPHAFELQLKSASALASVAITYYEFGVPGGRQRCTLGLGEDGTPFLPAVLHPAGSDGAVVRAGLARIMVGEHKGHLYVPADWLRQQLEGDPHCGAKRAIVDRMAAAVRTHTQRS
jgi:hypothetical protein